MGDSNTVDLLFDILTTVRYNNLKYVKCDD